MKRNKIVGTWLLSSALLATGCLVESGGPIVMMDTKPETWNSDNDPRRWASNMEQNWEVLRGEEYRQGASEIVPWVDTYWPMTRDGYNQRWRSGHLSPVELYDQAYNGWTPPEGYMELQPFRGARQEYDAEYYEQYGPAAEWAHEIGGNYRGRRLWNTDGTLIRCDSDGDNRIDGEPDECDFNGDDRVDSGDEMGGLEGWFGHCHAWAPAAFSAHEPQHSVEVNNVTLQVADIKALIEATYEGGGSIFLGGRCDLRDVERDEHGRILDSECRDTNPGSFHVVALNVMGGAGRSFVIDATYDYQVWNQPVRDYTLEIQEEVDESRALQLLGRTDIESYPYNDGAERFVHVRMLLRYIVEGAASTQPFGDRIDSYTVDRRYEYLLELEADGEIIGGEWIDDNPHPDFIWAPTGNSSVRDGGWGRVIVDVNNVQELIDLSTEEEPPPGGDEHSYTSSPRLAIPDNDQTGITDTIDVPDSLSITGLRVRVDITHTYRGDLAVDLTRHGETVSLFQREGGSADDLLRTFSVEDWNGASSLGEWSLRVRDLASQDVGTLNSWELVVVTDGEEPPPPPPPPPGDEHVFESSPGVAIPDDNSTGVTDRVTVPAPYVIEDLRVEVDITHTYRGDLIVTLERGGAVVTLVSQEGSSADDLVRSFDVGEFNGDEADGEWTIRVVDAASADTGILNSWSLIVTGEEGEEPPPPPPPPPGEEHVFESSPGVAIPDNDTAGVGDTIDISESMTIAELHVDVDITHSWRGDLVVELVRGDDVVTLFNREGGSADNLVASFDVTDYLEEDAQGAWTLRVIDRAGADIGTLNAWSLIVVTP